VRLNAPDCFAPWAIRHLAEYHNLDPAGLEGRPVDMLMHIHRDLHALDNSMRPHRHERVESAFLHTTADAGYLPVLTELFFEMTGMGGVVETWPSEQMALELGVAGRVPARRAGLPGVVQVGHGTACGGLWCLVGDDEVGLQRATCGSCGVTVLSLEALREVDPEAYRQLIDPDGIQRAFIEATGLELP
jgi:hypothetical protein